MQTPINNELGELLKSSRILNFARGDPILYQGEIPQYAYYIKNGVVKAYDIGNNGDEIIVALSSPGEFIPPAWVFNKSPVSMYYYSAFNDCTICALKRESIQQLIKTKPNLAFEMFDKYMGLYTGAVQQINALEQPKAANTIIYILQYLVMRFGDKMNQGNQTIKIRLTHQDLANMTGLTRETTTVELNRLKKKGIISYKDQHYSVQIKELQELLGSEEFNNFNY